MKEKKFWRDFGVGQKTIDVLSNSIGSQFILFDTETTGLSAYPTVDKKGRPVEAAVIIQLSAIKCEIEEDFQFREVDRFSTFINPEKPLPPEIVRFNEREGTGINDELLAKYPNEDTLWPDILKFFGNTPIVSGHNVSSFDVSMMRAMYERHGMEFKPAAELDTMRMAQELHLKEEAGSHKLGALAEHFGLNYGLGFHNAMDDVIATMRLLRFFVEEYIEKKEKLEAEEEQETRKIPTKVKAAWAWTGYKGMQRLYVRVFHENRVRWMNQRRPYNWGEKDAGSLDLFDMKDIEQQTLKLYGCETLDELSKVRDSRYAYGRK